MRRRAYVADRLREGTVRHYGSDPLGGWTWFGGFLWEATSLARQAMTFRAELRTRRITPGRIHTQGTYLAFHEVDDVDHWLKQTTRDEVFAQLGITHKTFVDPQGSNRTGLLLEIPDFDAFQEFMQKPEAAAAMAEDGERPETLVILGEG